MKQFLLIIIILLIPVLLIASVSEKRVALIIGNAAYKSMPLQNTLNDARAMDNALRECDFQIIRANANFENGCNKMFICIGIQGCLKINVIHSSDN
jgi:hypothetical protein